jgi:hypothetical protein
MPLAFENYGEELHWMFLLMHSCNFNDPPQVGVDYYRKRGAI